uniref:Ricin B lectin domain-containing protein n=1 Tax=Meloidogyne javanica TaxID=6303 RepID=A0A915MX37_MELJA
DFRFSFWEDIRPKGRNLCFDVAQNQPKASITLFACHGMKGNQHFKYQSKNKQLIHVLTSLCLDCDSSTGEELKLST